jgi:ketosteroid isomerase-like protein
MGVPTDRLLEVAGVVSRLYDDRDLEAMHSLYRDDAVFTSPNPPNLTSFGTVIEGREQIFRYLNATMDFVPPGTVTTVALLGGIDMAVWVWQVESAGVKGADVLFFDDEGLIAQHQVTAPHPG